MPGREAPIKDAAVLQAETLPSSKPSPQRGMTRWMMMLLGGRLWSRTLSRRHAAAEHFADLGGAMRVPLPLAYVYWTQGQ